MISNDTIKTIISKYNDVVYGIINSNMLPGYNYTFDQKNVSCKSQWVSVIIKYIYKKEFILKLFILSESWNYEWIANYNHGHNYIYNYG